MHFGSNLEEVIVNVLRVFVVLFTFSAFLTIKNIPTLQFAPGNSLKHNGGVLSHGLVGFFEGSES